MALRICLDCTTAYAVGAPRCPHCGSERGQEQGSDPYRGDTMPKITKHGGPSDASDATAGPLEDEEVPSSPGTSSSPSSKKPVTSQKTSARDRRKRAPTTGSRSTPHRTEGSTARSTDTGGPKTDGSDDSSTTTD